MIAVVVLFLSIAALSQFAMSFWRSMLTGAATRTISEQVLDAAGIGKRPVNGGDFGELTRLLSHVAGDSASVGSVRFYYFTIRAIGSFAAHNTSSIEGWFEREMSLCSQYVGLMIDQRLQDDLALL